MQRPIAIALLVVAFAANDLLAEADASARAIRDLSSPYLEARERAVKTLSRGGARAAAAMHEAYPAADFRTKALILTAFAKGKPSSGRWLIFADLGCVDRGVVTARRDLATAIYRDASEFATRRVVPRLPAIDWEWEEGIRALPSRAPSARRALTRLQESEVLDYRALGKELATRVSGVDLVREGLVKARQTDEPVVAAAAREIERLLIRHDVERAFFAVHRAGGGDGSYDGMFAVVAEVIAREGPVATEVLFWILNDTAPPEEGVPPARSSRYPFLEPFPLDQSDASVQRRAAFCLGDVGTALIAPRLVECYEKFEKEELDPYETPRQDLAHACASLGDPEPLKEIIREYESFGMDSAGRSRLAACYARLGDFEKAVQYFEEANEGLTDEWIYHYNLACAQSRLGRVQQAFVSLKRAINAGYGWDPSNIGWMERDGDLEEVRKLEAYQKLLKELLARFK